MLDVVMLALVCFCFVGVGLYAKLCDRVLHHPQGQAEVFHR